MKKPRMITTADRDSFAYQTISVRFPVILDGIIQHNNFSIDINEKLSVLKNSIPTGKLELSKEISVGIQEINEEIIAKHYTWNQCPFLFAENYFYHKLVEITGFQENKNDYFRYKKESDVIEKKEIVTSLLSEYQDILNLSVEDAVPILLKKTLGGNLADLSHLKNMSGNIINIIVDHTPLFLNKLPYLKRVDIILDNSGEELLSDVFFAKWLIEKAEVNQVFLHFKNIPYFVSDAMIQDFNFLRDISSGINDLHVFWEQIKTFIDDGRLVLMANDCWSDFIQYRNFEKSVLDELNRSDLLIFKGDLNYRKLVGDYYWDHSEKTKDIIDYIKTDILIIRILKSEIITGIDAHQAQHFEDNWLINGKYGVIEYCHESDSED